MKRNEILRIIEANVDKPNTMGNTGSTPTTPGNANKDAGTVKSVAGGKATIDNGDGSTTELDVTSLAKNPDGTVSKTDKIDNGQVAPGTKVKVAESTEFSDMRKLAGL